MARADGFEQGLARQRRVADPDSCASRAAISPPSGARGRRLAAVDSMATDLPSAIFFANYLMASGALAEFHDHGIRVPDDIAVAVFDDLPQLEYVRPRLTRVGNSPTALASRATEMLLERLTGSFDGAAAHRDHARALLQPFDTRLNAAAIVAKRSSASH